ncbi:MAG: alpha-galactosidase [Agriterribacter sp.]
MNKIVCFISFVFIVNTVCSQSSTAPIIIKTAHTALVYKVDKDSLLQQVYFGTALSDSKEYEKINTAYEAVLTSGSAYGREPAIAVTHANKNRSVRLEYVGTDTETPEPNVSVTHIRLKDKVYPFELTLHFKTYTQQDVIEQWTTIQHNEKKAITLDRYASSCLHLDADKYYLMHFFGDWANEMHMEESLLPEGIKTIDSKLGTRATNFDNPSFLLSLNKPASENTGEVLAGTLAWSGNFNILFENIRFSEDVGHLLQIIPEINPWQSAYTLQPGQVFTTPSFIYTYSANGKGQASRNLHQWALHYGIWKGLSTRQTLLNNWEATGFDFDEAKLGKLFDNTKNLGVDLFLLDDGWFANKYPRNSDNAGLGDWEPNRKKLPDGIEYLVKEAEKKGVKFGIWVEPEMVNPKSALYEKHPDWVIRFPDRPDQLRRNQLVLDVTNPAVQEHVYNVINNLLANNSGIAYIKWDCNRYMTSAYSPYLKDNQDAMYIDYVRGLYSVLEKIRKQYPDIEMMWCSGGGGRAEYGGLKYFQEFWPSDNTDGLSRIFIQWGYSYFFPAAATCAHVTSWGKQSIKFRTDVAMMGKLGFDIDLDHLQPKEVEFCKQAVQHYKRLQQTIGFGNLYRLIDPYDNLNASLISVDDAKQKAVLFMFNLHPKFGDVFAPVKLQGLDPAKQYTIQEINLVPGDKPSCRQHGETYSGDYLMKKGLDWFLRDPLSSAVVEITAQ